MNTINMLVTIVGLSVIGWIVWYFWLWKGEAVAAAVHASGKQEVDVTVKVVISPQRSSSRRANRCGSTSRAGRRPRAEKKCSSLILASARICPRTRPSVEVVPEKSGEYAFTCGMNMYRGKLIAQ